MNKILVLTFCLGLALTPSAHAADKEKKNAKRQAHQAAVAERNAIKAGKQNAKMQRNVQVQRNAHVQRSLRAQQNVAAHRPQIQRAQIQQENAAELRARKFNRANQAAVAANQNARIVNQRNRVVTQNNVVVRNRNSWYEARQFNWRQRHDRDWWRHHYGHTRFVLFGGGYYFWNRGYWYPAYGYDPAYSTYIYDEPIYGYNQYEPGRVISDVQIQLQRQGYYYGPVDGLIGPMTRSALARYQAEHGLYITRAIDEPTLEALGLV